MYVTLMRQLTGTAGDQRLLPLTSGQTPDHGPERLDEPILAVVAHQGVGLVPQSLLPEQLGVRNVGGVTTGSCQRENTPLSCDVAPTSAVLALNGLTDTLLAGVGQVVVAWNVAPLAPIMPHHHCTVLPRQEVAVWLTFVPVLIKLKEEMLSFQIFWIVNKVCTVKDLTRGFPSDQRKSPSMVLSFRPIHWYSLYFSENHDKCC